MEQDSRVGWLHKVLFPLLGCLPEGQAQTPMGKAISGSVSISTSVQLHAACPCAEHAPLMILSDNDTACSSGGRPWPHFTDEESRAWSRESRQHDCLLVDGEARSGWLIFIKSQRESEQDEGLAR